MNKDKIETGNEDMEMWFSATFESCEFECREGIKIISLIVPHTGGTVGCWEIVNKVSSARPPNFQKK